MAWHVIRNPYDAVATKCLGSVTTQQPTETNKYNNPICLKRIMTAFFFSGRLGDEDEE